MDLREKLSCIQQELKAPKDLFNSSGKYKYRNAESILEAFKPYEKKYEVLLVLNDEIVIVGDRIYVKANATIMDLKSESTITASAFAREPLDKKGMDDSQITGTASSYARKYALNGLLLLDDTKDADTDEYKNQTSGKNNEEDASNVSAGKAHIATLKKELERTGVTEQSFFGGLGISKWEDITMDVFKRAMDKFKKTPNKKD
ncbi:hypothetical protein M2149_000817 [Lachnospiraceae bacterium PFB1-21]